MINITKILAKVLFFLLGSFPFLLFSQANIKSGSINGRLIDSSSQKAMALATVAIFFAQDTSIITYRMSNSFGEFKVPSLPINKILRMIITYSGYAVIKKEFELTEKKQIMDFGAIEMQPSSQRLEEILVYAERPPVIIKKDTIEFNADAFKTLPNALVEDLLRKLPGVSIDNNGNIIVNGRKVNRILVDGKEFFGGDVKIATKNLPANIIDKVQVTDDAEEKERYPDKAKAVLGQVINLKLKKGIKQGWFGKAYAGGGTNERHEAGTILNLFRDTSQISVIGFLNNLNRPGFGYSDIRTLGGFSRSGVTSISTENGGLNINGISFGGTGEGIQSTGGTGFNFNTILKKGITLNTQYFYGQSTNDIDEINNLQQFIGDTVLVTRTLRKEVQKVNSHRVAFSLKTKIDSSTKLDFKPSFIFLNQNNSGSTNTTTKSSNNDLLNTSENLESISGNNFSYNHIFSITKNFKKKGRILNMYQVLKQNNTTNNTINNVTNIFEPSDTTKLNQLRYVKPSNWYIHTTLNFDEPISKQIKFRANYSLTNLNDREKLLTYDINDRTGKYEILNNFLSNNLTRISSRNNFSTSITWNYKKISIMPSINFTFLNIRDNLTTEKQKYNYIFPGFILNWNSLDLEYSVSVTPPDLSQIQTIPDNSNPLFVVKGNPNLKPVIAHNVYLYFYKPIINTSTFINVYLNGDIYKNGIIISKTITNDGTQTTFPLNGDNLLNFYTNASVNKQFEIHKTTQLNSNLGYSLTYLKNYSIINNVKYNSKTIKIKPYIREGINWNDKIEWNISYSREIYHTSSQNGAFPDLRVNLQSLGSDIVIRYPKKIVFESSVDYQYNSQAASGIQKNVILLNAGITWLFFHQDKGQLKIAVFDALNQNRSVNRTSGDNYINDHQINILRRYLLLTFTYDIRSFKPKKVGGENTFFLF